MPVKNTKHHLLNPVPLVMVSCDDDLILSAITFMEKSFSIQITGIGKTLLDLPSLIKQYKAEVVLLDLQMLEDNIHQLDSITQDVSTRIILIAENTPASLQNCFIGMRYGVVDYIVKSQFKKNDPDIKKELVNKIVGASKMDTEILNGSALVNNQTEQSLQHDDIVFCEDCGARNIFPPKSGSNGDYRVCSRCGDILETHLINRYKRTNYVTIIAAGAGSYRNLINIIPRVSDSLSGAIIIVVSGSIGHVDSLTRYLNTLATIKVMRITTGCQIEGGNCYIAAASENYFMKPHSTSNKMERAKPNPPNGPLDIMMQSVSESFKHNSAGLFLSGDTKAGENGLNYLKKNGGISAILSSPNCLHKQLGEHILRRCAVDKIVGESDATQFITELHSEGANAPATA